MADLTALAAQGPPDPEDDGALVTLPPGADNYDATAAPGGVPVAPPGTTLGQQIVATLATRGDQAQADGALASTAAVLLAETQLDHVLSSTTIEAVARHFGFLGAVRSGTACATTGPSAGEWVKALEEIAPNLAVSRFGLAVSPDGQSAAMVFGDVSLSLAPYPRRLAAGDTLTLRGQLEDPHFAFGHVYVTAPDGRVTETQLPDRRIDTALTFASRGTYNVEIMGDGPTGPVLVMNTPVHVGVDEPALHATRGSAPDLEPEVFAARLAVLLDGARQRAGLPSLAPDPALQRVALAHTRDMKDAHFFSHVSPTTGTVGDRLKNAGVLFLSAGENLSQAVTAREAHEGLMHSPGHRANMLGATFTHFGIGTLRVGSGSPPQYLSTLVFARRPARDDWKARDLTDAIATWRREKGVGVAELDSLLTHAAETSLDDAAKDATPDAVLDAAKRAFVEQASRENTGDRSICAVFVELLEPDDVRSLSQLADPRLHRMGVASRTVPLADGVQIQTVILTEGAPCAAP